MVGISGSQLVFIDVTSGTSTAPLYTSNLATNPDWSPSGNFIAYERVFYTMFPPQPIDSAGIHIFDLGSGIDRPLMSRGAVVPGHQPKWSPQGDEIAYVAGPAFDSLLAVDTTGSEPRVLATAAAGSYIHNFSWFRSLQVGLDGVMYMQGDGTSYYVARQGGAPRRFRFHDPFEVFSPTGETFVFIGSNPRDSLGVLFEEAVGDYLGLSRKQLTYFSEPVASSAIR